MGTLADYSHTILQRPYNLAPDLLLAASLSNIPLRQAEEISRFAARLGASGRSALASPRKLGDEHEAPSNNGEKHDHSLW